jgi:uronate dehydrogenase
MDLSREWSQRHGYAQTNLQLYNQLVDRGDSERDLLEVRRAYDFAVELFAGGVRPSGKPLLAHLVGTASILAGLDQTPGTVIAGLLHAAYSHGDFGDVRSGTTPARSGRVRAAVGDEVEERLAAYKALRWDAETIPATLGKLEGLTAGERELLLIRLANELEDQLDLGLHYSAADRYHVLYAGAAAKHAVEIARGLGFPRLAGELASAFDATRTNRRPAALRREERLPLRQSAAATRTGARPEPRRVLVTGAAGAIGRPVCRELVARGHRVRALDRRPLPASLDGLEQTHRADLGDRPALLRAAAGVDAIVHLAAVPEDADFVERLLPANLAGTYHVLEAAREQGVGRVVLASSSQVMGDTVGRDSPLRVDDERAPTNHYAVTKLALEAWGQMYSARFGMSVIVARPGWLPRTPEHAARIAADPRRQALYLSPGDAGRFFALCVEAADVPFALLFATSRSPGRVALDLGPARALIGYEPRDCWPEGQPHDPGSDR